MLGLGQCKVHGISVCVHAVINLQGLPNKIDRVKNVGTGILQGHGQRVCAHAVPYNAGTSQ
jgi:hypothetical protein